jgi:hypothetical protein
MYCGAAVIESGLASFGASKSSSSSALEAAPAVLLVSIPVVAFGPEWRIEGSRGYSSWFDFDGGSGDGDCPGDIGD